MYESVYWKKGATDLSTDEKTLTLKRFEHRYTPRFMRIVSQVRQNTIYEKYLQLPEKDKTNKELVRTLRSFDVNANVNWSLIHLGAAYRYLSKDKQAVNATGGTNWKDYLPPSFQKIIFFPQLWSQKEKDNWGEQWSEHTFNPKKTV